MSEGEPGSELVEHVDQWGAVVEVVSRSEIRRRVLRHRCTYVVVIDSQQQVLVHQRAGWKDVYPGWWDLCFGGICNVGEAWYDAATRELAEEAGLVELPLEFLAEVTYDSDDGKLIGRAYLSRTDAEPTCPDGEVVAVARVALADLDEWCAKRDVCPDSLAVVRPLLRSVS